MSRNVPVAQATNDEAVLPERVQEALGELVGAAKEGLLALSVGVGLGVLAELMEEEVDEVVGPKGRHEPRAIARPARPRGGRGDARRPPGRGASGRGCGAPTAAAEVPLRTYEHFADRDPLSRVGAGADARRRLDPPLPAHAGAGRRARSRAGRGRRRSRRCRGRSSSARAQALGELMSRQPGRRASGGDDDRRDRAARAALKSSRSGSRPRASRSRSGCGKDRPRTRPSRPRCCRTWSSAAWIPSRGSCS